jgi:hypothetical protein
MADDDSLRQLADRIQASAVRRMGELLKQFDGRPDNAVKQKEGTLLLTQAQVAENAGISEHQRKQAVRVANVPAAVFDAAIEQPKPATVTELSEMGKKIRAAPESFKRATHLIGAVNRFAEFCRASSPATVAAGMMPDEVDDLRRDIAIIDEWLGRFVVHLAREDAA